MTLAELAKQLNTTTMTIYRRLNKRGVKIGDLRDANSGELTPAGASMISGMFDAPSATTAEQQQNIQAERSETGVAERDETDITGGDAATVAVLRERVAGLTAVIAQLTDERDQLRAQLAAVTAALAAEQADRQHERRLLTGGSDQDGRDQAERRRGLFGFFRRS